LAPRRANSSAVAFPIPDEAPVITTILFCNRNGRFIALTELFSGTYTRRILRTASTMPEDRT